MLVNGFFRHNDFRIRHQWHTTSSNCLFIFCTDLSFYVIYSNECFSTVGLYVGWDLNNLARLLWTWLQAVGWVQGCPWVSLLRLAQAMFFCHGWSVKTTQKLVVSLKACTWSWPTITSSLHTIDKANCIVKLNISVAGKYILPAERVRVGREKKELTVGFNNVQF